MNPSRRVLFAVAVALGLSAPAFGQITWNFTYTDDGTGVGFDDAGVDPGEVLSRGQLRKNSVTAAATYLNSILDGRGTANLTWNASLNNPASGVLASFGPGQLTGFSVGNGSFQSGGVYQAARSNTRPFPGADGSGQVNFGHGWNYAGQANAPDPNSFDLVTVGIHEITHGLGFAAFMQSSGQGLQSRALGTPDLYSAYARFMQRGNGPLATSALLNSDVTSTGYGSFTGAVSTLTNGNDTTTGLFFGGAIAREVFGGAVPLFAPNPFQSGSSLSHVNDANAVMNPSVTPDTVKRFRPYEIAMLMDIGWNVYNWNGTTGNWLDGQADLTQSRWTTDSGIVFDGTNTFNINATPNEAPVLPVGGQTTANVVLLFRGVSAGDYTATNNIGTVRLARLRATGTSGNAITIAGGTLNFGQNSDGSPSVLTPKVVQESNGSLTISSAITTNNIATTVVGGVSFPGHSGLTVDGTGSGAVALSGAIGGSGGLTKGGAFVLTLSGNNNYSGPTVVNGGTLVFNGNSTAVSGAVSVNGGTLSGTGIYSGPTTVFSGGAIEGGNSIGDLTINNNLTIQNGGALRAELGVSTADQVTLAGSRTLDLRNGSNVTLVNSGFNASTTAFALVELVGATSQLRLNGVQIAPNTVISEFTSTGGNGGTVTNVNGSVNITLSGFNLTAGDKITLRRNLDGNLGITFTPVPEPGTVLGVCALAAGGLAAWRRRK